MLSVSYILVHAGLNRLSALIPFNGLTPKLQRPLCHYAQQTLSGALREAAKHCSALPTNQQRACCFCFQSLTPPAYQCCKQAKR